MRFDEFQRLNQKRCSEAFHNHGARGWPIENWLLAMAGEIGEACNLAKKILRGDFTIQEKREDVLNEIADVITYADLAMTNLGADTGQELLRKFGEASNRRRWAPKIEKVYLAASFISQEYMREVRSKLDSAGIQVTSRWLDFKWTTLSDQQVAEIDINDINASDAVVIFTHQPSTRGGFHFEAGYALASGKPVIVVGERINNFLCLPQFLQVHSFDELVGVIHAGI